MLSTKYTSVDEPKCETPWRHIRRPVVNGLQAKWHITHDYWESYKQFLTFCYIALTVTTSTACWYNFSACSGYVCSTILAAFSRDEAPASGDPCCWYNLQARCASSSISSSLFCSFSTRMTCGKRRDPNKLRLVFSRMYCCCVLPDQSTWQRGKANDFASARRPLSSERRDKDRVVWWFCKERLCGKGKFLIVFGIREIRYAIFWTYLLFGTHRKQYQTLGAIWKDQF